MCSSIKQKKNTEFSSFFAHKVNVCAKIEFENEYDLSNGRWFVGKKRIFRQIHPTPNSKGEKEFFFMFAKMKK